MTSYLLYWSLAGAALFALITLATGGKVRPARAALMAMLAGPGVWLFIIAWVVRDYARARRGKPISRPAAEGIAEAQRDAALSMLEIIVDDHRNPAGDTCLGDGMEDQIDGLLEITGRRQKTTAKK